MMMIVCVGSGKSNAFGVSYVPSEDDGFVEPPPSVEELVEHGNSVWEVRSLSFLQISSSSSSVSRCSKSDCATFRECSSIWFPRALMLWEGKKTDPNKPYWIY